MCRCSVNRRSCRQCSYNGIQQPRWIDSSHVAIASRRPVLVFVYEYPRIQSAVVRDNARYVRWRIDVAGVTCVVWFLYVRISTRAECQSLSETTRYARIMYEFLPTLSIDRRHARVLVSWRCSRNIWAWSLRKFLVMPSWTWQKKLDVKILLWYKI